jgi:hypothetical protein
MVMQGPGCCIPWYKRPAQFGELPEGDYGVLGEAIDPDIAISGVEPHHGSS